MNDARILIVEDSPTQAEALRALLEPQFEIGVAASGEAALELLQQSPYDLVLSDVMMPGMNGYELCRAVKDTFAPESRPGFILLTSLNDPSDVVRGLEAGADTYITKPYEPRPLLERINTALRNRSAARRPDDGDEVTFLDKSYTITAGRNQILSFLLAAFEDLVRTNTALQESKQAAEAATRARDDVLAMVSHDLRNPLATIYTSSAMMMDMPLPDETRKQQIGIIHRTARRMMRLLEDLLDVSRMEAGGFAVTQSAQPVAGIIDDAMEMLQPVANEKGITVVTDVAHGDTLVLADKNRILQALSNLTGNAVKFTPAGGTVTIRTELNDQLAVFSVADTGPGISSDQLPRVFERFYQGGARSVEGAGLGLAIVRGIIKAHGGDVWVESELGQGTTFSFSLPVTK